MGLHDVFNGHENSARNLRIQSYTWNLRIKSYLSAEWVQSDEREWCEGGHQSHCQITAVPLLDTIIDGGVLYWFDSNYQWYASFPV